MHENSNYQYPKKQTNIKYKIPILKRNLTELQPEKRKFIIKRLSKISI